MLFGEIVEMNCFIEEKIANIFLLSFFVS